MKSFGDMNTKRSEKNIKPNVLGADQEQKKLLKKSVIAITQYRKNTTARTLYV